MTYGDHEPVAIQDAAVPEGPRLDWLEDLDHSDPLVEEAVSLILIVDSICTYFDEIERAQATRVAEAQRQQELSAATQLERAKKERRGSRSAAVADARKRLVDVTGSWRQYSPEEVQKVAALAFDPDRLELAGLVSGVQSMLSLLKRIVEPAGEDLRKKTAAWMAYIYSRLRAYAYFTQQTNRAYLSQRKDAAWTRTCNVTSLSMALASLGITAAHVDPSRRRSLVLIFNHLEGRTDKSRDAWESEISRLLLPDFLQLVAVDYFLERADVGADASMEKRIEDARALAAQAVTTEATIFAELASKFGVKQYRVRAKETFDSLPSAGREVLKHANEQQTRLRLALSSCLAELSVADGAPALLCRTLWNAGFRNFIRSEKVGIKIALELGPLSMVQQNIVAQAHRVDGERVETFATTRSLMNAMYRYSVAFHRKTPKSATLAGEAKRILLELDINSVVALASKRHLLRERNRVPLIWSNVAQLFNCHVASNSGLAELETARIDDLRGASRQFVDVALREWRRSEEQLQKYRKSSGEELRAAAEKTLRPLLDEGAVIVVLRAGHYVSLVDFNRSIIVLNDPAYVKSQGSQGRRTEYTWEAASKLAFFRAFHVFFHPSNSSLRRTDGVDNGEN